VILRQDERGTWVNGGHVERDVLLADVIELRGAGSFLLHGRTADLVNIAGKRTSLAHLNYHLNSIEGVRDGTFVMPAEEGREVTRLVAFVVAPGLSGETIMNALRQRIDAAFLPRPLQFVEALPRNMTGKLPREALNELIGGPARKAG
jgi:acyl-coenzyme A synthetase/AMP-(fatty) acid ligase